MLMRCLIIDDEPYARKLLEEFCQRVPMLSLEGSFSSALAALEPLRKKQIDLIFLDIQMPDISGLDFLKSLDQKPAVIFTTAHADYALEGFELDALDYLLKPFDFQRFLKAINKASQRKQPPAVAPTNHGGDDASSSIFLKDGTRLVKVALREILYIRGMREYVTVHTSSRKIITLQTMKGLEQELPSSFVRVHNSYIVSLHAIESLSKTEVEIAGESIPIGSTYRRTFVERLRQFFPDRNIADAF